MPGGERKANDLWPGDTFFAGLAVPAMVGAPECLCSRCGELIDARIVRVPWSAPGQMVGWPIGDPLADPPAGRATWLRTAELQGELRYHPACLGLVAGEEPPPTTIARRRAVVEVLLAEELCAMENIDGDADVVGTDIGLAIRRITDRLVPPEVPA